MQCGELIQSQFRAPARQGWSARDFRVRSIRYAPARGRLSLLSHPTSGSWPWKICLLLDETAHAHPVQFLLRPAEPAAAAVVPRTIVFVRINHTKCNRMPRRDCASLGVGIVAAVYDRRRLQQRAIRIVNILAPKNENHFVDLVLGREEISGGLYGDLRCIRNRIAICAATDRRKSNRLDAIFNRELQRAPITISQGLRLTVFSSSPNRADRVNDKARRQTISASNFRFPGSTTAEGPAFCK